MREIDKPFRPGWDFLAVWAILAVPGVKYAIRVIGSPWYSVAAFAVVVPFLGTFLIYGPVLFIKQIVRSGSRGRLVGRVFASIIACLALLYGGLYLTGNENIMRDPVFLILVPAVATVYLNARIREG